jgi:hypothetical protein
MGRDPRRVAPFRMPVTATPAPKLPPAAMFHFWHPERDGVEHAPKPFDRELKLIHPGLFAVRPPAAVPKPCDQRWIIWQRDASIKFWMCQGWKLLFLWPPKDYDPIPLDHRVFANLAIIDPRRYASSVAYFDTIVKQLATEQESRNDEHRQYLHDKRRDLQATWKISSAGRGNRFALHHDGTIVPSRGEANWTRERERLILPSDVARERRERGKGRF